MKNIKYLLLLFAMFLLMPFTVFAEGEETTGADESNEVKVYFFRGEGCPHCAEAEEWFDSIEDEYGSKFEIIDYETWNDAENAKLMSQVAEVRGETETATGVPYIIIGDKSWVGFAEAQMADEIKSQIDAVYNQPVSERYDAVILAGNGGNPSKREPAEEKKDNSVAALIVILIAVGGVCFGIYKARENTK